MFVVITKYYKDVVRDETNSHLPGDWPAEVKEVESLEGLDSWLPDAQVFTLEEYRAYSAALQIAHPFLAKPKKSFWKFWSKK